MKKTFISGNLSTDNIKKAQSELKNLGLVPIYCISKESESKYIKERIKKLSDCDYIYMLKNWESCEISKVEYQIAKLLNIVVIFQDRF
jgi:hypothetical protein